jgi:hypothetical protein
MEETQKEEEARMFFAHGNSCLTVGSGIKHGFLGFD